MKTFQLFSLLIVSILFILACKKQPTLDPLSPSDTQSHFDTSYLYTNANYKSEVIKHTRIEQTYTDRDTFDAIIKILITGADLSIYTDTTEAPIISFPIEQNNQTEFTIDVSGKYHHLELFNNQSSFHYYAEIDSLYNNSSTPYTKTWITDFQGTMTAENIFTNTAYHSSKAGLYQLEISDTAYNINSYPHYHITSHDTTYVDTLQIAITDLHLRIGPSGTPQLYKEVPSFYSYVNRRHNFPAYTQAYEKLNVYWENDSIYVFDQRDYDGYNESSFSRAIYKGHKIQ